MDIGPIQNTSTISQQNNNTMNLDFLGGSNPQNETSMLVNQMFSLNLGLGQPSSTNPLEAPSQRIYQQPIYQTMELPLYQQGQQMPIYQTGVYQPSLNQPSLNQEFLMDPQVISQPVAQQPIYQNFSLKLNEQPKPE
jgi:hypothetical protein